MSSWYIPENIWKNPMILTTRRKITSQTQLFMYARFADKISYYLKRISIINEFTNSFNFPKVLENIILNYLTETDFNSFLLPIQEWINTEDYRGGGTSGITLDNTNIPTLFKNIKGLDDRDLNKQTTQTIKHWNQLSECSTHQAFLLSFACRTGSQSLVCDILRDRTHYILDNPTIDIWNVLKIYSGKYQWKSICNTLLKAVFKVALE